MYCDAADAELLAPIMEQNDEQRACRRRPVDIDAGTGKLLPDDSCSRRPRPPVPRRRNVSVAPGGQVPVRLRPRARAAL